MPAPPTQATREHWDAMASTYDAAKSRNDVYYRTLKACFDRAIPPNERGRILEVGCGTGQILASLKPAQGIGADLSEKMIEAAKRQFAHRPELSFRAVDGAALTGLGEFDAVISADVIEHVEDWPKVVATMVRSCRPGGLIAISTPNPRWTFPLWVLEKAKLKMAEGPHRFVSGKHIAARLRELGCDVLSCTTSLILPMNLAGVGPRLSATIQDWPIFRGLGVIQMVVARKQQP